MMLGKTPSGPPEGGGEGGVFVRNIFVVVGVRLEPPAEVFWKRRIGLEQLTWDI